MSTDQHEPGKFQMSLIFALPFIGTAVVIVLSYWLYQLNLAMQM
nr:hypothetical protein [Rhodopirellula sp. SM50]